MLLGAISPQTFMRRHWHKTPLLIRQAFPGFSPVLSRSELFELASREEVESRLIARHAPGQPHWRVQHGPFARRDLPRLSTPDWTLLVQGVDLHHDAAHELLQQFRFIPDARLDDLMISFATEGGGVGPHYDSYDVFLLQAQGQRRWRLAKKFDPTLRADTAVKILANFEPEQEFVLAPGDMLYLPQHYAHDGVAEGGECMTYSIGFRSPARAELAQELLTRLGDEAAQSFDAQRYRDPKQEAVQQPAAIPHALQDFAQQAIQAALRDPQALARALGELLSEPKPNVWFESAPKPSLRGAIKLDRRTRMLYDDRHIFINGESFRAGGRDARLMHELADRRSLPASKRAQLSREALDLLGQWLAAGWLHSAR